MLYYTCHTQDGWSALMKAAREGRTDVVVELVKAGANLNLQHTVCQYLMLEMFVYMNQTTYCMFIGVCI